LDHCTPSRHPLAALPLTNKLLYILYVSRFFQDNEEFKHTYRHENVENISCSLGSGTLGLMLEEVDGVGIRIAEDGILPTASVETRGTLCAGDLLIRIADFQVVPTLLLDEAIAHISELTRPLALVFQRHVRHVRDRAIAALTAAAASGAG
jgi:hypothetical protein